MIRVYVAGVYSDTNVLAVLKNIGKGEYWAGKLFMDGFAPFTPWHDKSFVFTNWDKEFTVPMFYDYSMEWLRVSDIVFVIPNSKGIKKWEDSIGIKAEIEEAERIGIPVIFDYEELLKLK